jgi:hypothetical protein
METVLVKGMLLQSSRIANVGKLTIIAAGKNVTVQSQQLKVGIFRERVQKHQCYVIAEFVFHQSSHIVRIVQSESFYYLENINYLFCFQRFNNDADCTKYSTSVDSVIAHDNNCFVSRLALFSL